MQGYKNLVLYAKGVCARFGLSEQPEELLNDAYISVHDLKIQPTDENIKKRIQSIGQEMAKIGRDISLNSQGTHAFKLKSELNQFRVCSKCNENFPISSFRHRRCTKRRRIEISNYCPPCENAVVKQCIDKDRPKWNAYLKDRYNTDRKNLTDAYIRKLLRNKYSTKVLLVNQSLIIKKRNDILTKRRLAGIRGK